MDTWFFSGDVWQYRRFSVSALSRHNLNHAGSGLPEGLFREQFPPPLNWVHNGGFRCKSGLKWAKTTL